AAIARILGAAREIAKRRGVSLTCVEHASHQAVALHHEPMARAVESAGYPVHRMISGAGHDAMILAQKVPASMLFLRSPGGISHHPDETVLLEDVDAALAVGERFLEQWS